MNKNLKLIILIMLAIIIAIVPLKVLAVNNNNKSSLINAISSLPSQKFIIITIVTR